MRLPQVLVVVPTRELALQVHSVLSALAKYTTIQVYLAVPAHADAPRERERITAQVVVGTPGKLQAKLQHRDIDPRHVKMFIADEADQMVAQEGFADTTIGIKKSHTTPHQHHPQHLSAVLAARRLMCAAATAAAAGAVWCRRLPPSTQILLFSATFDSGIRAFAKTVAPSAIEIEVKTEELSLDSIKQFYVDCPNEAAKYSTLTSMYGLLEIGQSIIFVHSVATAKLLANRMRADGYTVSLLHGRDMEPAERDRVMDDFRKQNTTVLITTNVLARGIDVLSITLVVNFDIPLTRYNRPDPETYIHRIGRSGRFGRKGVAINFVSDDKSRADLAAIAQHFQHDITQLPTQDIELMSSTVQNALKA